MPGLLGYLRARCQFVDSEVATALAEGATQVVILRSGLGPRGLRLLGSSSASGVTVGGQLLSPALQLLEHCCGCREGHPPAA